MEENKNVNVNEEVQTGQQEETKQTFDDLLKDKEYQSAFDKKIAKALETSKAKWETEYNQKLDNAKSEAEKLSKMKAEEKAQYQLEKAQKEYEAKLKDLNLRELKAEANTQLVDAGLPKEFSTLLNYDSAETVSKSIDSLKGAFFDAVQKEVIKKIGSNAPKKGTSKTSVSTNELYAAFLDNPTQENYELYQKALSK